MSAAQLTPGLMYEKLSYRRPNKYVVTEHVHSVIVPKDLWLELPKDEFVVSIVRERDQVTLCQIRESRIDVMPGYEWDGATGGIDKGFEDASLFHDALCQAISEGLLHKKNQPTADRIMRWINKQANKRHHNMPWVRRWVTFLGVRGFQALKWWRKG